LAILDLERRMAQFNNAASQPVAATDTSTPYNAPGAYPQDEDDADIRVYENFYYSDRLGNHFLKTSDEKFE
jgi:hypothetical protein